MSKQIILNDKEIKNKIRRIAFQIIEVAFKEDSIVLAGVSGNGFTLAKKIKNQVEKNSSITCVLCEVFIDKKQPLSPVKTSLQEDKYKNTCLILVDDVLNSGTTLIYSIKHFLEVPLKKFKTAVLINRNHKKYPVKADFKGLSLSTSIQEHIQVEFNKESTAYLL